MISEYILFLLVLPTVVLWNIRLVKKETKEFFLEKENSIALKGMSAFFVIAAHYMVWGGTTYVVLKGIVGQLGGIEVFIFFFVSGCGIWKSYEKRVIDYH